MGKYSKTAILLHWLIAILIVANVALATLSEDLPRAARAAYMDPHKAIGISILTLSVLRLLWRLGHRPPPPSASIVGLAGHVGPLRSCIILFSDYRCAADWLVDGCRARGRPACQFLWAVFGRPPCGR